jgi:hypothetical protein
LGTGGKRLHPFRVFQKIIASRDHGYSVRPSSGARGMDHAINLDSVR